MSNLTIIKRYDIENLSPKLNDIQKEIIFARNTESLKQIQSKDKTAFLIELMKAFYLAMELTGQNKSSEDYEKQAEACVNALERDFRTGEFGSLTNNELTIAIQRGCKNIYGDFFGVNYSTITQFIKGYVKEQNEAITKQRLHEANLKWDAQQEEKAIKARKDYEKSFVGMIEADKAKKKKEPTKMVKDYGSQKFIQLQKEGTINLTEIEVTKLKERTLLAYAKEVSEARKLVIRKRAATTGDKIKPVFRLDNEESERASKNRIFRLLAYNEFLKG